MKLGELIDTLKNKGNEFEYLNWRAIETNVTSVSDIETTIDTLARLQNTYFRIGRKRANFSD